MKKILTNNTNLPLSIAALLAYDSYDYVYQPNTYSATTLIRSLKQIILERRMEQQNIQQEIDIISLTKKSLGNSIHENVLNVWENAIKRTVALTNLGYSQDVINRIVVNPEPEDIKFNSIPIYVEKRSSRELNGFKIRGKFDYAMLGKLSDLKSTTVYTYIFQNNIDKYILQGSIYRWLNPTILTDDYITIIYFFTDFKQALVDKDPKYPKHQIIPVDYPLMSLQDTEAYLLQKTNDIRKFEQVKEEEMPICTPDDLWLSPSVFKYYATGKVGPKSTKNFNTLSEAETENFKRGGKGAIIEVKGKAKACLYCNAYDICKQKDTLIQSNMLDPKE